MHNNNHKNQDTFFVSHPFVNTSSFSGKGKKKDSFY